MVSLAYYLQPGESWPVGVKINVHEKVTLKYEKPLALDYNSETSWSRHFKFVRNVGFP